MQETWVRSLGLEDPLEKEMVAHSSILAWEIPWTEEPGGLQFTGSQESDTTERLNHHGKLNVSVVDVPSGVWGAPEALETPKCLEGPPACRLGLLPGGAAGRLCDHRQVASPL